MAFRALGSTYPNPPVGAIIVKNGIILSRGWTQRSGSFHAEVHAINQIRNQRMFELGWDVMRFWVYEVRDNLDESVNKVKLWLENKI